MSISINNLLRQFRVQLPILTALPEVVPPGAEFYYNGTKWRGLGAGESSLPEGTPWPVKGYKELSAELAFGEDGGVTIFKLHANDFGSFTFGNAFGTVYELILSDSQFTTNTNFISTMVESTDDNEWLLFTGIPLVSDLTRYRLNFNPSSISGSKIFSATYSYVEANFTVTIKSYPPQP